MHIDILQFSIKMENGMIKRTIENEIEEYLRGEDNKTFYIWGTKEIREDNAFATAFKASWSYDF